MRYLLDKSTQNFHAATLLFEKSGSSQQKYYAPAIHCLYYGCLQSLKYILLYKLGETEESWSQQQTFDRKTNQGTHSFLIERITQELRANKKDPVIARSFQATMKDLKNFRHESDYDDSPVNQEKCYKARLKAEEIQDILKKVFSI
ncbi:MAG: hypothetical protein R3D00_24705 [Bacteroidia bacterium]